MNNVLLLLVFAGLVGLLLVVFYLLDRVNALHNQSETARLKRPFTDSTMTTMNGRILWDVLTGEAMQELDEEMISQLRSRYEMVLQKHIELLFEDGTLDGREGFSMPVSPERKVPTLRGEFISWIPHEFAKGIYMAGHDRATKPETEHSLIAANLDNIGNDLFEQVGMPPIQLSKLLMPNIEPHVPTPESQTETNALQSEVPALPAPDTQPTPLMMVANAEGEAMPALTAMTMDPATGAPATNAANAAIEQNIATSSTESAEATSQANVQANAQATAQADQAPTTTPAASEGANSEASPVTAETNANDSKASNPEKVA
ncbi:MAG: hypothetical protein RI984_1764 [Pseudomonadota bacterium]|jgi:hypothetical protein